MRHIILVVIMFAALLAGCGSESTVQEESDIEALSEDASEANGAEEDLTDLVLEKKVVDTLEVNEKYELDVGDILEGRLLSNDILLELVLVNVRNRASFLYNGEALEPVEEGEKIELSDNLVLRVDSIIYNDPSEKAPSFVYVTFLKQKVEHYPAILIEEDIGKYEYASSRKFTAKFDSPRVNLDGYEATYDSIVVQVVDGAPETIEAVFRNEFPVVSNIFDTGREEFVYLKKTSGYSIAWYNKDKMIIIMSREHLSFEHFLKPMFMYLDKYQSSLDENYNCENPLVLKEKGKTTFTYEGDEFTLENYIVSDKTLEVRFRINGDLKSDMVEEDTFEMAGRQFFIKEIVANEGSVPDEVILCHN